MSHFLGLCFGANFEDNLDKYDENLEVEKYISFTKEQAIKEQQDYRDKCARYRKECLNSFPDILNNKQKELKKEYEEWLEKHPPLTDEEAWNLHKEMYLNIDKEGNTWSTYNPDAQWDWYSVGGRWSNYLPTLDGEKVNQALFDEIDWDKYKKDNKNPFCFVDEFGDWHECAKMGWWGQTSDKKPVDEWDKEFWDHIELIRSHGQNPMVTAVDFHI